MRTLARVTITFNAAIFILVLPALEISATHIFNEDWPGHARLHNAWQLVTNACLAILATWLAWRGATVALALVISTILSASFVSAFALQDLYGGTMQHSDGSELLVYGVNPAIGLLSVLTLLHLALLAAQPRNS